jgi:RNA polymerase sigma factor (sigma-70 family)
MSLIERQTEITVFFTKEQERLRNYIRSRLVNMTEMDIEDLLQDLFLNLFNKADISIHIENLAAYIYRSIQNRLIDYLRKKGKTVSLEENTNDGKALADLLFDPNYDVDKEFSNRELRSKLYDAVHGLEPKQRAVWIATEIEDYSFRELSVKWDEPIGTLLSRKHRAVQSLQTALKDFK